MPFDFAVVDPYSFFRFLVAPYETLHLALSIRLSCFTFYIFAFLLLKCSSDPKYGYTATPVACGWAGAVIEKVTREFGQEQRAQNAEK